LYVDGRLIANSEFPVTTPIAFNPGGLTCGANPGSAITGDYRGPFPFTGTLHTVTVDLSGDLIVDTDGEMRMAMSRQ
jgi:arylsulfatase